MNGPPAVALALGSAVAVVATACWEAGSVPGGSGAWADADTDTDPDSESDSDTDFESDPDPLDCAGGRYDAASGLCWQHPRPEGLHAWSHAFNSCYWLVSGGHDDWTLPSRDDFAALLGGCDESVFSGSSGDCNACAESETCTALFGAEGDWYWTRSSSYGGCDWVAYFDTGLMTCHPASIEGAFRCVRPGP